MYYLRAYYQEGEMYECFSGELKELHRLVVNGLSDPENFKLNISDDPIGDFEPCTLDDLKDWA